MMKSIKSFICGDHHTVIFSNSHSCIPALENILKGPIRRLSVDDSSADQSTSIKKLKTRKLHRPLSFIETTTLSILKKLCGAAFS